MLTLQRMTHADFPAYLAMKSDPEDVKWSGFLSAPDTGRFRALFDGWLADSKRFMLVARAPDVVGYFVINVVGGDADTSYGVAAAHRGRGYGTLMNIRAAEWVQQNLAGLRLTSWIAEDNEPSIKSVIGAGFKASSETKVKQFYLPRPHKKTMRLYLLRSVTPSRSDMNPSDV